MHKKAKKIGLDVTKYNELKDQISLLELDLKRLKDPLRANLPRATTKQKPESSTEEPKTIDAKKEKETKK